MTERMTALQVAEDMALPPHADDALQYNQHPQTRTLSFHEVFGAPIGTAKPDATFSHMDDQRVAFRTAFILSEALEMLEKGLGLKVSLGVQAAQNTPIRYASSSDNAQLTNVILAAMQEGGQRDTIEVVDALADLNVVVNGFAVELGVDMLAIDQETLASNFTKLDENGEPIVADGSDPKYPAGKILKGPNFIEPQIGLLLGLE